MAIILDTCAFLAITGHGDKHLSPETIIRLENEEVYVSAITAFEIGLKAKKGKLLLGNATPRTVYHRILHQYMIEELPLTGSLLLKSTELGDFHADPFDRMIMTEAITRSLDVATWDTQFEEYLASQNGITIVN